MMRINLGTVTVSDIEREAIANYYGYAGKAPRDTTRRFIIDNGMGDLDTQVIMLQKDREEAA